VTIMVVVMMMKMVVNTTGELILGRGRGGIGMGHIGVATTDCANYVGPSLLSMTDYRRCGQSKHGSTMLHTRVCMLKAEVDCMQVHTLVARDKMGIQFNPILR
jgi:lactate dehydrogenase-like 2-hydroxyacid dehydrogenase